MKKQINAHPRTTQISGSLKARLASAVTLQAELLAVSRAGHDKDTLYVVLAEENEYFWLADGKRRGLESPKKKKKIHVQLIRHLPQEVAAQLQSIELDAHLRKAIKLYEKSQNSNSEI